MDKLVRLVTVLVVLIVLYTLVACEIDTKIEMDGNNPPTFSLSGNGQLWFIEVRDLSPSEISYYAPERTIWKITTGGGSPARMPKIKYGEVPAGFEQEIPGNGGPPALVEEKPYSIFAYTSNANGDSMMFLIRGGKALKVTKSQDGNYYVQSPAR